MTTSNGAGGWDAHSRWHVRVWASPDGRVVREVAEDETPLPWDSASADWTPEATIWPCAVDSVRSDQVDVVPTAAPLRGAHEVLTATTDRVREAARWMASVVGVTLGALVGTAPLTQMRGASGTEYALAAGGLVCLAGTLLLVLRVLQPASVDYLEVQLTQEQTGWRERLFPTPYDRRRPCSHRPSSSVTSASQGPPEGQPTARREAVGRSQDGSSSEHHPLPRPRRGLLQSPLLRWKSIVESQQDLYLPCGIKCLTSLRRAMIVEEVTLAALADAHPLPSAPRLAKQLEMARSARAARLAELREAAARVAQVGELYVVKRRSAWAAYVGGPLACLGTALIVSAFVRL